MAATTDEMDRRTTALERAQNDNSETLRWPVGKVAGVQAQQDDHTLRLERIETRLDRVDGKIDRILDRLDRNDERMDRREAKVDQIAMTIDAIPRAIIAMLDERDRKRQS